MKRLSTLSLIILLSLLLITLPYYSIPVKANPAWLTGWEKRVKITINSTDVDEALTNFPVLIFLSNSSAGENDEDVSFVFDEVGSNSKKIAVTTSDEETECYVEIEKWDSTNEEAWLWVKIPSISNISDTDIYLYYDNDHADNTVYVGDDPDDTATHNVWDDYFKLVTHTHASASPIKDSTSNNNDGGQGGDPTYQQTGVIDGAVQMDGNDYFNHGSQAELKSQVFSLEGWIKTDDYTKSLNGAIRYGEQFASAAYFMYELYCHDSIFGAMVSSSSAAQGLTVAIGDNNFHYMVMTYDSGQNLRMYKDGVEVDGSPLYCGLTLSLSNYDFFAMGARVSSSAYGLDGKYEEVRYSDTDRDGSWVETSYESEIDHLLDFGTEESPALPTLTFYNNTGGIFRVDNVTIANETQREYGNNTLIEFEIVAIVEGNMTYGFNNFTYNGNYNYSNPFDFSETITANMTLWVYFGEITVGDGVPQYTWMFYIGIVFFIIGLACIIEETKFK